MNRIVLIGNGFDLAHDLKTSYKDFIDGYWQYRFNKFGQEYTDESKDLLCTFKRQDGNSWNLFHLVILQSVFKRITGKEAIRQILEDNRNYKVTFSPFFEKIIKSIETKGWVDIENEYYELLTEYAFNESSKEKLTSLNGQLQLLKLLLVDYLKSIENQATAIDSIREKIYEPIRMQDISIEAQSALKDLVDHWSKENISIVMNKILRYGLKTEDYTENINYFHKNYKTGKCNYTDVPCAYMLPDAVLLLSFNYTHTAELYYNQNLSLINYLHGNTDAPNSVIFGYGDESDTKFKELQNKSNDGCLKNVKTIRYLESDNYRNLLSFMDAQPYQVCIMGHSCGNSDHTLLNTLFEHKNCVSIKPYYYLKDTGIDNYIELVQNISRNFTDMKLMRDRVVNKQYCEFLTH